MTEIHPLRRYLFDRQITTAQFAETIGVSRSAISLWTHGHRCPSLRMAVRIRDATGGALRVEDMVPPEAQAAAAEAPD